MAGPGIFSPYLRHSHWSLRNPYLSLSVLLRATLSHGRQLHSRYGRRESGLSHRKAASGCYQRIPERDYVRPVRKMCTLFLISVHREPRDEINFTSTLYSTIVYSAYFYDYYLTILQQANTYALSARPWCY